jgi:hypothetical protein
MTENVSRNSEDAVPKAKRRAAALQYRDAERTQGEAVEIDTNSILLMVEGGPVIINDGINDRLYDRFVHNRPRTS